MNQIQRLQRDIAQAYSDALTTLERPLHREGIWSLDIDLDGRQLAIEWGQTAGFGISSTGFETFGEAADEHFDSYPDARRRVEELLATGQGTVPPLPVLLSRLRAQRGVTQKELARRLDVSQATISGMERREDIHLSTLSRCVEALGGTAEIYAVFVDARYRIDKYFSQVLSTAWAPERELCRGRRSVRHAFESLDRAGDLGRANELAATISARHSVIEML